MKRDLEERGERKRKERGKIMDEKGRERKTRVGKGKEKKGREIRDEMNEKKKCKNYRKVNTFADNAEESSQVSLAFPVTI